MTAPGDRSRWNEEPTVSLHPVEQPTVVLPVVPPSGAARQPEAGATAAEGAPPAPPPDEATGSVARNSGKMALGSLVSRATGFLRAAAIAAAIGGMAVGDNYNLANNLPNMVYQLLLDGVLSSVLIPQLVRARKSDADRGQAYAQRLLTLAVIAIGIATLLVVLAAPLLTALVSNNGMTADDRHLITFLAYLLLPEIFFYALAGIFAAILNTRGHFGPPMWTPILNNIVVIITAGTFAVMRIGKGAVTPETITTAEVLVLGIGTTIGILVQAFGLWPALRKAGFRWAWRFDFRELHLGELARLGAWMLVYVSAAQIGILVVMRIAKLAGTQGAPGPIIYNNAFLIFMMAHGIVAVSVITAIMPRMSSAAADGRYADMADQMSQATRLASVVLLPAAAFYIALGRPIAVALFQGGEYTHAQAVATGWVISVAGFALVPYAINQLQTSAFYALRNTRTPALLNVPVVGVRIAIDVAFYFLLPISIVTASLMAGTALSFVFSIAVGYWLLRRQLGPLGLRRIADTLVRLTIAAAVGALPAFGAAWLLSSLIGDGKLASLVQVAVGGVVLVAAYAAVAVLLRVREVRQFGGMIRRRIGR
jgi:putative peptidoglycan lipid II flippase